MMTAEEFYNKHYQYPQSQVDQVTRESAIHFADAYKQHILASDGDLANVRILLPDILNGIKTATPELLPKEWIQNEDINGNYMGGFLTGVRWVESKGNKS
jgi:hypothetical protein